jgi:hypothetical protein
MKHVSNFITKGADQFKNVSRSFMDIVQNPNGIGDKKK